MKKYVFAAIGGYIVGWTITYVLIMGSDFRYFFKYLKSVWTWEGPGELPAFMNFGGLAGAFVAPFGMWFYLRFRSK